MATPRPVAAGVLASAAAGTLFSWSIVSRAITEDLDGDATSATAVFSIGLACFTLALLLLGPVVDRASPRDLLALSALVSTSGLALGAAARQLLFVTVGVGVLFAAGGGLAYLVSTRMAAQSPEPVRGRAVGVVVAGYAASPVALGVFGPFVISAVGWRASMAGLAVAVGGATALAPRWAGRAGPRPVSAGGTAVVTGGTAAPLLLWVTFAFGSAPALVAFAQAVEIGLARRLDLTAAGLGLTLLATGNVAGRLLAGLAAGRCGSVPALATALALQAAGLGTVIVAAAPAVLLLAFTAVGIGYGGLSALVPLATSQVAPSARFARTYGFVFTGWGVAGLAAPLVAAHIAARSGYDTVFRLTLVALVVATASLGGFVAVRRRAG